MLQTTCGLSMQGRGKKARGRKCFFAFIASLGLAFVATEASALSISVAEVRSGNEFPLVGGKALNAPKSYSGSGTLAAIMNSAGRSWEDAIADGVRVTIHYGWGTLGSNVLGRATVVQHEATIVFNNNYKNWFVDSTPEVNNEYGAMKKKTTIVHDISMNSARYFRATQSGDAKGHYDLLTVARHEVGHGVGALFHVDDTIKSLDQALLVPSLMPGLRRDLSTYDAYKTAEFAGYMGYSTYGNVVATPLPAALPLAISAIGALGALSAMSRKRAANNIDAC